MSDEEKQGGEVFASVWDALEDSPAAATHMRLRSELMLAIAEVVTSWAVPPEEAARRLDVTVPRLEDLLRGRISTFSLDSLVAVADRAGLTLGVRLAEPAG